MSSATRPLGEFLQTDRPRLAKGPIAILLIEDDTVVQQTLAHHLRAGFRLILALSPEPLPAHALPEDRDGRIVNLIHPCRGRQQDRQPAPRFPTRPRPCRGGECRHRGRARGELAVLRL